MTLLIIFTVIIIVLFIIGFFTGESDTSYRDENYRERASFFEENVYNTIVQYVNKDYVYKNLYIKRKNNRYTEIDILAVHQAGVLIFECKDYNGWIFGEENRHTWYQTFKTGDSYEFYNPIFQNQIHINAVKHLLKHYNMPYYSIIVFNDTCELKNITSERNNVYIIYKSQLNDVLKIIENVNNQCSKAKLDNVNMLINKAYNKNINKNEKHLEDIKIGFDKCPYCNGELVKRVNKQDNSVFYGCSNYPKCKYTSNYQRKFV